MGDESKPPMRQIAELIEGIATARAESAERLLGECETQLIETRAHLGDMVGQLGHREAEIARLEEYADAANETAGNAIREVIDLRRANAQLDATIARLEAELAAERERTTATQIFPPAPPAPPADDPRIAALCNLVGEMYRAIRHAHSIRHDPADLETITGRR